VKESGRYLQNPARSIHKSTLPALLFAEGRGCSDSFRYSAQDFGAGPLDPRAPRCGRAWPSLLATLWARPAPLEGTRTRGVTLDSPWDQVRLGLGWIATLLRPKNGPARVGFGSHNFHGGCDDSPRRNYGPRSLRGWDVRETKERNPSFSRGKGPSQADVAPIELAQRELTLAT